MLRIRFTIRFTIRFEIRFTDFITIKIKRTSRKATDGRLSIGLIEDSHWWFVKDLWKQTICKGFV